ncbi:MarR family transcriptional regulator [Ramlibacter tataouinensis]|uniref:MarR family transcriptional regulator n=1 Tax=Ramlibacter tataouinensis TaxID=94132 RepID=A0A140HL62_9BURK|nr:MarR family transcriptional regulator [Ramlibacter tataouinensis]
MQVLRKFRLIFNTIKAHFRDLERKTGVAGAQVWALSVLRDQPGIGVNALARELDIRQSTASNLLKPLIEQQLVTAERAQGDRRSVELRITPRGLRVLKKAPAPFIGVLPEIIAQLDARTLSRLDEDLEVVIRLVRADREASRTPLGQPEEA